MPENREVGAHAAPLDVSGVAESIKIPLTESEPLDGSDQSDLIARAERPATGLRSIPRRVLPSSLMRELRNWTEFPDIERHWAQKVRDHLLSKPGRADWVITTSPPESLHTIGRTVADHYKARWCAELRDSWVDDSHRAIVTGLRSNAEAILARRLLSRADAIAVVNDYIAQEVQRLTRSNVPVMVLPHFSQIQSNQGGSNGLSGDAFDLLHSGAFRLSDRRRRLGFVLQTLNDISQKRMEGGDLPLRLHLTGHLAEDEIEAVDALHSAETKAMQVLQHGMIPLEQSRRLQAQVDGLLLYVPEGSRALPGKYAEYALSGKPVFLLGSDAIRKMAVTPDLMQPLDGLHGAAPGDTGPIDMAYDASGVMQHFVQGLIQAQT